MFGTFQQSQIRIEVEASKETLGNSLLKTEQLSQWLWFRRFSPGVPEQLQTGTTFTSWVGPVAIEHQVERADEQTLRLLLSKGIDGYHEWYWGDRWVQSRIEGITLLPLNLGQTLSLLSLRQYVSLKAN
ncbi:MAG: hypothetical protein ACFB4I_06160 [Cyanophyceae cyanobacterium]